LVQDLKNRAGTPSAAQIFEASARRTFEVQVPERRAWMLEAPAAAKLEVPEQQRKLEVVEQRLEVPEWTCAFAHLQI